MTRNKVFPNLPDFSDRKVVDRHLERLDTTGVSRRDFLALASAGAAAAAGASALGLPNVAVAAPSGKLAFLTAYYRNEYNAIADKAFDAASRAFGVSYTVLDGNFDSQLQLNQFEQQAVAGTTAAIFNLADGSAIRRIAKTASANKIFVGNVWGTLAWYTPFDADEYYALYAVPDEVAAHRGVTRVLLETVTTKFGGGDIIGVTGVPGHLTDIARSRGRDEAFKEFPKTRLVGQLPGKWNREDSLKATEDLLTRNKNVVGVVAQNDDVAQGVIAALRAAGIVPGRDVFVVGADGTSNAARAIESGQQLATSANSPAYVAGLFTARIYDVTHGWVPRASERLQYWRSITTTKDNVSAYLERYVDNKGVEPFDYRKISKVLHPTDWDPQAEITPLDIDHEWGPVAKPEGWIYPKAYLEAKNNGEWEKVKAEYAEHYKIKFDGPSPVKAA
jgi:ABC-type sugar transport system substrate-binding protein